MQRGRPLCSPIPRWGTRRRSRTQRFLEEAPLSWLPWSTPLRYRECRSSSERPGTNPHFQPCSLSTAWASRARQAARAMSFWDVFDGVMGRKPAGPAAMTGPKLSDEPLDTNARNAELDYAGGSSPRPYAR